MEGRKRRRGLMLQYETWHYDVTSGLYLEVILQHSRNVQVSMVKTIDINEFLEHHDVTLTKIKKLCHDITLSLVTAGCQCSAGIPKF